MRRRKRLIANANWYCLSCFTKMGKSEDTVQTCASCGFKNIKVDRRVYWNQNRDIERFEAALKTAIVLGSVALVVILLLTVGGPYYTSGYVVALGFIPGLALWLTASKLTRHHHYFDASLFWTVSVLIATATLLFGDGALSSDDLVAGIAGLGLGLLIQGVRRTFSAWKNRKIGRSSLEPA